MKVLGTRFVDCIQIWSSTQANHQLGQEGAIFLFKYKVGMYFMVGGNRIPSCCWGKTCSVFFVACLLCGFSPVDVGQERSLEAGRREFPEPSDAASP